MWRDRSVFLRKFCDRQFFNLQFTSHLYLEYLQLRNVKSYVLQCSLKKQKEIEKERIKDKNKNKLDFNKNFSATAEKSINFIDSPLSLFRVSLKLSFLIIDVTRYLWINSEFPWNIERRSSYATIMLQIMFIQIKIDLLVGEIWKRRLKDRCRGGYAPVRYGVEYSPLPYRWATTARMAKRLNRIPATI